MCDNKHFNNWIGVKENLHNVGRIPAVKEGEIWWCGIGENVGVEINGKAEVFSRPVIIFKKLSRFGFMGIPLTSQPHVGSWYVSFVFQNKNQTAVLAQARVMSVSRLYNRIGATTKSDFNNIKIGFSELYLK